MPQNKCPHCQYNLNKNDATHCKKCKKSLTQKKEVEKAVVKGDNPLDQYLHMRGKS